MPQRRGSYSDWRNQEDFHKEGTYEFRKMQEKKSLLGKKIKYKEGRGRRNENIKINRGQVMEAPMCITKSGLSQKPGRAI